MQPLNLTTNVPAIVYMQRFAVQCIALCYGINYAFLSGYYIKIIGALC